MPRPMERRRFHVLTGPKSLFERVRFKMAEPQVLDLGQHARLQKILRQYPLDILHDFPVGWEVNTAEVRTDTGKFVRSTWRKIIGNRAYWVAIGYSPHVITVYDSTLMKSALGPDIVTSGSLYDFVAEVNRKLMEEEQSQSTPRSSLASCNA